jgi:KDO2-lipid IV(A) lauroyltransferase
LADRVEITPAAKAQFAMARARGRGVLVATLHLGNWELMAAALATQGIDFTAVGARPKASPLHRWLTSTRSALGVVVLSPGGGARSAASHLGEGGTVAFFVDQSTGERSRSIQFFHHTAPTPTTYERLLQLTGATPLLVWTARDADGIHRVHAENLPRDTETNLPNSGAGHPSNPPILPLDWLTARAETLIRTYPTQWIWLHRRWGKHSTGA